MTTGDHILHTAMVVPRDPGPRRKGALAWRAWCACENWSLAYAESQTLIRIMHRAHFDEMNEAEQAKRENR